MQPKSILTMHCCKLPPTWSRHSGVGEKRTSLLLLPSMVRKRLADKRTRLSNGSSTNTGKNILPRAVCPHCGQKHPRKLICDISDYMRVVQHNLRELLHEGQFSCPVVACSRCGTVYADRPVAMPVPHLHAAGCQASADLVIE